VGSSEYFEAFLGIGDESEQGLHAGLRQKDEGRNAVPGAAEENPSRG
jgi:hypothetical protein